MGELTLAQYQTRVRLACGNVPVAHPVFAEGMHTTAINNAPNTLIRENPDLFPEHQDNTWTVGATIVGDNLIELPENLLILERVTCSRDAVVVGSDWTAVQEYPVALISGHVIGLIDKPATTTGYPTMCDRKGNALWYNVTTQTGFTTYFRFYGVAGEVPLVGAGETFRMHRDFDTSIIQYATAETLEMMGQYDRAMEVRTAAERNLQKQRGVVARERAARPLRMTVAGMPPL
jgi:hypothetical protein